MIPRLRHQVLSPMEVFQAPILTPLTLIVVRAIKVSASLERKDDLGAVSLVTGSGIVLLDRVKEAVMVDLSLKLQKHQQVAQLSRVIHLVLVVVSARTGCMLFKIARIRKVLPM